MKKSFRSLFLSVLTLSVLFAFTGCEEKKVNKGPASPTNLVSTKRNVIYTYTLGDVMYPEQHTHIIISFFKADGNGNVFEKSFPHTADKIISFKQEHPGIKILGALGGGVYSEFLTPCMLKKDARTNLANQLAAFVKSRKLDGIDLDWEYYDDYVRCNAAYLDLAKQLRKKMPRKSLLTMAGQQASQFYREESIVEMMTEVLDFTSVMTYDMDYEQNTNNRIGYNGNFTKMRRIMEDYAKACNGDKSKLNSGLPYYGRNYKIKDSQVHYINEPCHVFAGTANYTVVTKAIGEARGKNPDAYDDDDGVAISVKNHDLFVYDNETTLSNKVKWSCEAGFGGVMEWVASDDNASATLQKAVCNALNNY